MPNVSTIPNDRFLDIWDPSFVKKRIWLRSLSCGSALLPRSLLRSHPRPFGLRVVVVECFSFLEWQINYEIDVLRCILMYKSMLHWRVGGVPSGRLSHHPPMWQGRGFNPKGWVGVDQFLWFPQNKFLCNWIFNLGSPSGAWREVVGVANLHLSINEIPTNFIAF